MQGHRLIPHWDCRPFAATAPERLPRDRAMCAVFVVLNHTWEFGVSRAPVTATGGSHARVSDDYSSGSFTSYQTHPTHSTYRVEARRVD